MVASNRVKDTDKGFEALKRRFRAAAGGSVVKVGVLNAGSYPSEGQSGSQGRDSKGRFTKPQPATGGPGPTIAEVAFWNEFGRGHVPSRPAFRLAVDQNRAVIGKAQTGAMVDFVSGRASLEQALGRLGLLGQRLVRKSIVDLDDPPNAPMTIAQKGSSNPLIDTGQLRQSITFEVVRGPAAAAARSSRGSVVGRGGAL